MKNFLFILAAIFALSSTQASADEDFYAGVFGGANWLNISGNSHHSSDSFSGYRIRDRLKFDTGYIVGGSIGYRWCGGLRVEGEIAYRNNQRKKHHSKHSDCCDVVIDDSCYSYSSHSHSNRSGNRNHAQTVSYMANVLYDLPFECTPWKAFVGAGIGYAQQKGTKRHDRFYSNSSDSCSDYSYSYSCEDSSYSDSCYSYSSDSCRKKHSKNNNGFAAQAIVGLGYNYCDCFELTLEYRYLYVSGKKNFNSNNNAIIVGAQTGF